MKIFKSFNVLNKEINFNENIGFVPTMGSLDDGHLSLIKIAKRKSKKGLLKEQLKSELQDIVLNNVSKEISSMLASSKSFSTYLKKVQDKKIDPFEAADKLTKGILK